MSELSGDLGISPLQPQEEVARCPALLCDQKKTRRNEEDPLQDREEKTDEPENHEKPAGGEEDDPADPRMDVMGPAIDPDCVERGGKKGDPAQCNKENFQNNLQARKIASARKRRRRRPTAAKR